MAVMLITMIWMVTEIADRVAVMYAVESWSTVHSDLSKGPESLHESLLDRSTPRRETRRLNVIPGQVRTKRVARGCTFHPVVT